MRRKAAVGGLAVPCAACSRWRPLFAPFEGLIRLTTIGLYCEPSEKLLELLRQKAPLLGDAGVAVHVLEGGLTRFGGAG